MLSSSNPLYSTPETGTCSTTMITTVHFPNSKFVACAGFEYSPTMVTATPTTAIAVTTTRRRHAGSFPFCTFGLVITTLFLFQLNPSEVLLNGSVEEKKKTTTDDGVSSSWSAFISAKLSSPSWRHGGVDDVFNLTTTNDGMSMADDDEFIDYLAKMPKKEQQLQTTNFNESELMLGGEKVYNTLPQVTPTDAADPRKNPFRAPMKSSKFNNKAVVFHLQEAWLDAFALNETEILNEQHEQRVEQETFLDNATVSMMISAKNTSKNEAGNNETSGMDSNLVDAERSTTKVTESLPKLTPEVTSTITTTSRLPDNGTLPKNGTSPITRYLRLRRR